MKDPTEFWRYSQLKRLRTCAKIIFSAPVSSAAVERLFNQAGILLSKMRKRVSPAVMKKLVYIRYQNKYKELINKLGIVIDPGELEKAIDEDREKKHLRPMLNLIVMKLRIMLLLLETCFSVRILVP